MSNGPFLCPTHQNFETSNLSSFILIFISFSKWITLIISFSFFCLQSMIYFQKFRMHWEFYVLLLLKRLKKHWPYFFQHRFTATLIIIFLIDYFKFLIIKSLMKQRCLYLTRVYVIFDVRHICTLAANNSSFHLIKGERQQHTLWFMIIPHHTVHEFYSGKNYGACRSNGY